MFVVVVTFQVKQDQMKEFLPKMLQNAEASLQNEVGCSQFDVCVDEAQSDIVFLYEVYSDRAAFDIHLSSTHFLEFDRVVAPMIETKQVQTFTRVSP
ncbi:MAG: putative quinol monooxygenase [Pseudomonadota bacterium]